MLDKIKILFFIGVCSLLVACNADDVDFSYSPESPRAGAVVSFKNLSTTGDEYEWSFGDGATSTATNSTHTYRRAGTYLVTLKVTDKKTLIRTKELVVLDTIPSIVADKDSIVTFDKLTLSIDYYNPNNLEVSFAWDVPNEVVVLSDNTEKKDIDVYFSKSGKFTIGAIVQVGNKIDTIHTEFVVVNQQAAQLIMANPSSIYLQKIHSLAAENTVELSTGMEHNNISDLLSDGNVLYILNSELSDAGGIIAYSFETNESEFVVKNGDEKSNFNAGLMSNSYLYWTDGNDAVYKVLSTERNKTFVSSEFLYANNTILSDFSSKSCGLAKYGEVFITLDGKGIYRFTDDNIVQKSTSSLPKILTSYEISKLTVDNILQKIYFLSASDLYVCNIDGENVTKLLSAATAIYLSVEQGRLYVATDKGVGFLPRIQSRNNQSNDTLSLINNQTNIIALSIDNTLR